MKLFASILFLFVISGCSLISSKSFQVKNENVSAVARHNLYLLKSVDMNSQPYLIVNKKYQTTPKDLFLFINETQEPLEESKKVISNLIKYDEKILEHEKK